MSTITPCGCTPIWGRGLTDCEINRAANVTGSQYEMEKWANEQSRATSPRDNLAIDLRA